MLKVNVHDIKTHLSKYLAMVEQGEHIVICKRNVPLAELHALTPVISEPRPIGLAKGKFKIPTSFFDDLPDDIIKSFEDCDT